MAEDKTKITIFGAEWCPPCHMVKNYLKDKKIAYDYISVDEDPAAGHEIAIKTGWSSIPIIQIGEEYILGFDRPRIDSALSAAKLL